MWQLILLGVSAEVLVWLALARLRLLYEASPCSPALLESLSRRPPMRHALCAHLASTGEPWELATEVVKEDAKLSDRNMWWMGWNQVLSDRSRMADGAPKVVWFLLAFCFFMLLQDRLRLVAQSTDVGASFDRTVSYVLGVGLVGAVCCHVVARRAAGEASSLRRALRALGGGAQRTALRADQGQTHHLTDRTL